MTLRIASAPVNVGIYGGVDASAVDLDVVLASVVAAGYDGMELGPPGLFGTAAQTAARFAGHGLAIVGAYVPLHLAGDASTFAGDLDAMRRTLDELAAGGPGTIAILADEGSPALLVNPARPWDDRSLALDGAGWELLGERLRAAVDIVTRAGVRAGFHPHISTYVESPWEAERVLAAAPVGLTLDTGHLRLAGGDPTELLARWGDRVEHIHLKDVDTGALARAKATGRTDFDAWWPETCVALGSGDADVRGFLAALVARGYDGWIVVEQDHAPVVGGDVAAALAADARNAAWLRAALAAALPVDAARTVDTARTLDTEVPQEAAATR
jgi:inosose dehydratase